MLKVEPLSMRNLCSYINGKRRKWKRSFSNTAHHNSDLKIANTFLSALRARNIINFQRRAMLSGHVGGALITFFYELIPSCRCRDDWWWGSKIGFLWRLLRFRCINEECRFVCFVCERAMEQWGLCRLLFPSKQSRRKEQNDRFKSHLVIFY